MIIYINGKFLTQRLTGVQRYALEVTKALIKLGVQIKIIVPTTVNISALDIPEELFVKVNGFKNTLLWEQFSVSNYLRSKKEYVLLSLCNMSTLYNRNQIICIHDMAFAVNPSWFHWAFSKYYNFMIPRLVHKAKKIFTVSEFSKKEIGQRLGVPAKLVSVVYNAPSEKFKCADIKDIVWDKGDYFLFVGSFDPRKNLAILLELFSLKEFSNQKLIIIGGKSRSFKGVELSLPANVEIKENCNDDELANLYRKSKALINCSLYEGFGLPIIEAMASGCPLILSDIEVFREVAGSRATYFKPNSIHSLRTAFRNFLKKNSDIHQDDIIKNYEHSLTYTWEKSSQVLLSLINSI